MPIGIDARFYRASTGGIGRYTRALLRELAKIDRKNQYTVFLTPADEKEYDRETQNSNVSYLGQGPSRARKYQNFKKKIVPILHYSIAEQIKFLKILNQEKFDLVHFTNFNHPIFYRGKFVITIHDLTLMLYPQGRARYSLVRRGGLKLTIKDAVRRAQRVIAISQATKKDLVNILGANPEKIEVIYEGIDPQYNTQSLIYPLSSLAIYKIKKPYLLFVSQWRPHKGILQLVEAFEILKKRFKIPHQLVVAGEPNPNFPEILSALRSSSYTDEIIRPGFIPEKDLPDLYRGADLFVFPSHYEGFGLPPLEAMACGTAVAASNLSSIPEVLGKAAEYFDPSSPEDIAAKINKIIGDKRKKGEMIKRGLEQVKRYRWEEMAKKTLRVYQRVLR